VSDLASVAIIGAGDLGQRIARRLLADDVSVRMASRRGRAPAGAEGVTADISDPHTLRSALERVDAVVVAVESAFTDDEPNGPERVHHQGVRNVLAVTPPAAHIAVISQIYVTRPAAAPGMAPIIAARARAEHAVRTSGRPYTIVRPSWLTDEPGGRRALRLEQTDTGDGRVSRDDVAALVVAALRRTNGDGLTFEAYNADGAPPVDVEELLVGLTADEVAPPPDGCPAPADRPG